MSTGRPFACSCSEETRAEAESWLREAFPGMPEDKERIPEGGRDWDLVESVMVALDEFAQVHGGYVRVSIMTDMWCGVGVEYVKDGETVRNVSVTYDYGLLPHALAKALTILEEEFRVEGGE